MIPLKINSKNLIEIMLSADEMNYFVDKLGKPYAEWTDEETIQCSLEAKVFPTEVTLNAEQYSRDASRTADYELENITIVNCKSKPEFVWALIKASYVQNLLSFLSYTYNYKDNQGDIIPIEASTILVTYMDFTGIRTISAYLGQSLSGSLVEYSNNAPSTWNSDAWVANTDPLHSGKILYWQNFRISFPER